jgi:hypothetical protein
MNNSFPDFCWSTCELALKDAKVIWESQAYNYGILTFLLGIGVGLVTIWVYSKFRRMKDEKNTTRD